MQWYLIIVSVATTGAFGWFALELIGRPIRRFLDLRRSVRHQMLSLANVPTPQPRETCVTSEQIRQYDRDLKNAREAQRILRDLASQILAFAESERAACIAIRPFGFDPSSAGSGLIGLSNALDRHGTNRASFRKNVERALRFS
jgi:HAMP domain-containing protein